MEGDSSMVYKPLVAYSPVFTRSSWVFSRDLLTSLIVEKHTIKASAWIIVLLLRAFKAKRGDSGHQAVLDLHSGPG